jgi:uncharacterized membrane protein
MCGVTALTSQSFWMDEASTATIATQPTLTDWWRLLSHYTGSDTQMPFYMLCIWGWVKLWGCSEWGLRAANLPWLLLGLLALPRRQPGFVLALAASPFLWFYLNEARPYVMQIGASLMVAGALVRLMELPAVVPATAKNAERNWMVVFCFGLAVLSGSSLLGMFWSGAAVGAFLLLQGWHNSGRLLRASRLPCTLTALFLGGLGGYYLWTIRHGNSATPGSTGIANVFFIAYELSGLAGLGPGRAEIHGAGLAAFHPVFLPLLTLAALVLASVLLTGMKLAVRDIPRRVWLGCLAPLGAVSVFLMVVGVTRHVTMLGRHFAPLGVCFLLCLGWCLQKLLEQGGWRRFLAVSCLLLSLVSAGSLRWCERHQKDDYRKAAGIIMAAQARGERIWWCADGTSGVYYGVPLTPAQSPVAVPGRVWLIANPPAAWLTNNPKPTLLLLSKPELHDNKGFVRDFLQRNHFECRQSFSVFTVWIRP